MKKNASENYLDKIPEIPSQTKWSVEDELVVIHIENKGFFNTIAQKLFKKPRTSFIHLDEMGSFIWQRLDGNKSIFALSDEVKEKFGESAEPLFERLANYIRILESYGFINLK